MEVLLKSVSSDQSTKTQTLAASILANLGGNYTITGEPSTIAWLIKKAGLHSNAHRSMIKGLDISDQSLQVRLFDQLYSSRDNMVPTHAFL